MNWFSKFGFSFGQNKLDKEEAKQLPNQVTDNTNDGAIEYSNAFSGMVASGMVTAREFTEQKNLITQYRKVAEYFDVDNAISEIVNEMISINEEEETINVILDDTEFSEQIKERIREEFRYILKLLDFNTNGYNLIREWYVDGMVFHHIVVDIKRPKKGIIKLVKLDPCFIKKVRQYQKTPDENGTEVIQDVREFYVYDESGKATTTYYSAQYMKPVMFKKDAISYVHSGIVDKDKAIVKGHLHKAVKPANQLQTVENSLVIYRLSRAPERRAFYVDVGSMPKTAAASYLTNIKNKYKNKMVYDVNTGTVASEDNHMSMLEDFWLPRREGSRGTEISVLQGGQNLGEIDDIVYFQKRLLKALNVPQARMEADTIVNMGNTGEITREELKFSKFIQQLRSRFNKLFLELLKTQLVLKKVITREEWDEEEINVKFDYVKDSYIVEAKELEVIRNRADIVEQLSQYEGKYYSRYFIQRKVLRLSEEEIKEEEKRMEEERKAGVYGDEDDQNF